MARRIDLSGRWTGVYFYPVDPELNPDDDLPPTPFTAELTDAGGLVTGTTLEPDVLGPPGSPPIPAILQGRHDGGRLIFTKFPEGGGHVDPIDYDGDISPDGELIDGRWTIPGEWSGVFRMQRRSVTQEASATIAAKARS